MKQKYMGCRASSGFRVQDLGLGLGVAGLRFKVNSLRFSASKFLEFFLGPNMSLADGLPNYRAPTAPKSM